jgi:hypothetical protein
MAKTAVQKQKNKLNDVAFAADKQHSNVYFDSVSSDLRLTLSLCVLSSLDATSFQADKSA